MIGCLLNHHASVVQRLGGVIIRVNLYISIAIRVRVRVKVSAISFPTNIHPLYSDLPGTQRYPMFEQPGPAR